MFQNHTVSRLAEDSSVLHENLKCARTAYAEKQFDYLRKLGKSTRAEASKNPAVAHALQKVHTHQSALSVARMGAGFEVRTKR